MGREGGADQVRGGGGSILSSLQVIRLWFRFSLIISSPVVHFPCVRRLRCCPLLCVRCGAFCCFACPSVLFLYLNLCGLVCFPFLLFLPALFCLRVVVLVSVSFVVLYFLLICPIEIPSAFPISSHLVS